MLVSREGMNAVLPQSYITSILGMNGIDESLTCRPARTCQHMLPVFRLGGDWHCWSAVGLPLSHVLGPLVPRSLATQCLRGARKASVNVPHS